MVKLPDEVWADDNSDGTPKEPYKPDIRDLLNMLLDLATAAGVGAARYPNKTTMDADHSKPAGTIATLYADPTVANNYPTFWYYNGSVWVQGVDRLSSMAGQINALTLALSTLLPNNGFIVANPSAVDFEGVKIVHALTGSDGRAPIYTRKDGASFISGMLTQPGLNHALYTHIFTDKVYRFLGAISKMGGLVLAGGNLEVVEIPGPPGVVFVDKNWRAYARSPNYPNTAIPVIGAGGGTSTESTLNDVSFADVNFVALNGQSLSIGALGIPLLYLIQQFGNLMLSGGLRSDSAATDDSLIPLIEQSYTPPGSEYEQGETGISKITDRLVEMMLDEAGLTNWADLGSVFMGSAVGLGGTPISQLDKPSATFSKYIAHIQAGFRLATSSGKSFNHLATIWRQGESDYRDNTSRLSYYTLLKQYVFDVATESQAITKSPWPPMLISYQTQSHRYYARTIPVVALATRDLAREPGSEVRISTPCYIFDYVNHSGDVLHMTNYSYDWLGWFEARLLKRIIEDRLARREVGNYTVDVLEYTWQTRVIDITYNLPRLRDGSTAPRQLAFDTTWVTAASNMGYDLRNEDGTIVVGGISSVTLVGKNRVRIVLAADPAPGQFISYAWGDPASGGQVTGRVSGPRGNLRDVAGVDPEEQYTDAGGTLRAGHHWAVIHEILQGV